MKEINSSLEEKIAALRGAARATVLLIQNLNHPDYAIAFSRVSVVGDIADVVLDPPCLKKRLAEAAQEGIVSRLQRAIFHAAAIYAPETLGLDQEIVVRARDSDGDLTEDMLVAWTVPKAYGVVLCNDEAAVEFPPLAYDRACAILSDNTLVVAAISIALLERKTLSQEQCQEIASGVLLGQATPRGVCPPLPTEKDLQPLIATMANRQKGSVWPLTTEDAMWLLQRCHKPTLATTDEWLSTVQ